MGKLKVAEDPKQATTKLICEFQEAFTSIGYSGITPEELKLNNEMVAMWTALNTKYATKTNLP